MKRELKFVIELNESNKGFIPYRQDGKYFHTRKIKIIPEHPNDIYNGKTYITIEISDRYDDELHGDKQVFIRDYYARDYASLHKMINHLSIGAECSIAEDMASELFMCLFVLTSDKKAISSEAETFLKPWLEFRRELLLSNPDDWKK